MLVQLSDLLDGKVFAQRVFFTNKDLWNMREEIEVSPDAYQRFFHADYDWQQLYIASFFNPMVVIPEIALRVGKNIPKGSGEVMDGCQRVSTGFAFKAGEVALPEIDSLKYWIDKNESHHDLRGRRWRDLPRTAKDTFEEYQMAAQVYKDLTPEQAGWTFVSVLNNTNTLNAQEKRQAISSDMSRTVQQWARLNPLGMFDTTDGITLDYIAGAEHKRLDVDKTLAELCYMLSTDDFLKTGTTGKTIDLFYREQAKDCQNKFPATKITKEVLTFAEQSFKGFPTAKTIALKPWRNYCYLVSKFLKAKITIDPIEFIKVYKTAVKNLKDKSLVQDGLTGTPYELRMRGNSAEDTRVSLEMLELEMSKVNFKQTKLDSKRTFTREEVANAYEEQNGKCAICGEDLGEFNENVHGDHFLLYKDGHPTTPDNCDAVHASCNWRK